MKKITGLMLSLAAAGFLFGTPAHAADKKVERLWKSKCASCHGKDGTADTEKGKKMKMESMATAEFQKKFTDDKLKETISNGLKKEEGGVKKEMDGYKDELKAGQLEELVAFIRELGPKK